MRVGQFWDSLQEYLEQISLKHHDSEIPSWFFSTNIFRLFHFNWFEALLTGLGRGWEQEFVLHQEKVR